MTNDFSYGISTRVVPADRDAVAKLRRMAFVQAKYDSLVLLAVFTIAGFGLVQIVEWFFLPDAHPLLQLAIALSCGLLAAIWMFVAQYSGWLSVRKDVATGECVELQVSASRALAVWLTPNELPGIALECGEDILILIGNWWESNLARGLFRTTQMQMRFPVDRFTLNYFPASGRVISVDVSGKKLRFQAGDPNEPTIDLELPKYADVVHVKQDLDSLLASKPNRQTSPPTN